MPFNPQELIINTGEGIDSLYTASQKINQNFNGLKDILENYVAVGALICFGTYDASTAEYPTSPLLTKGSFWVITTGGTIDSVPYLPNDWIVYNDNDEWFKVDNGEITWSRVNKTFSDIVDIQRRSHTDLQDIGTNTHDDIDEHISDTIIHAAIDDEADSLTTIWSSRRTAQGIANIVYGGLNLQNAVLARDLTEPPVSPSERDRYIVASPATGDWAGHEDEITQYTNSAWVFYPPSFGDCVVCDDERVELAYNGNNWIIRSTVSISATTTSSVTAGEALSKYQAVYINTSDSNKAYKAINNGTSSQADVLGLVNDESISEGATGNVLIEGILTNNSWNWVPNQWAFLDSTAGVITQTRPVINDYWAVPVGLAISATELYVRPMTGWRVASPTQSSGLVAVPFSHSSTSPVEIFTPPNNAVILKCAVVVSTAANYGTPTCSVGIEGDVDRDMSAASSNLSQLGSYVYEPFSDAGVDQPTVYLTLTGHAPSGVEGMCYVQYMIKG